MGFLVFRKSLRIRCLLVLVGSVATADVVVSQEGADGGGPVRPNILFAISDDQSWMHASAYGDKGTLTPAFDRVAREGVLFNHAYTACPSCTPSRSAILTGQQVYRLEEGGVLLSFLPNKFEIFTRRLESSGYQVASTGKTWGPGKVSAGGWKRGLTGKRFSKRRLEEHAPGVSSVDYAGNFEAFLEERDASRPFFFWYGSSEPHQSYDVDGWKRAGKKLEDARLPACLPDSPETRGEILDYGLEIEHFDRHLGRILARLEEVGELDRTLVLVTSDHGNPLPRSKCNLYDSGVRVPLSIRFPEKVLGGRRIDDFVSLTDIAPTLLEVAGLEVPAAMTGRSLWPLLTSKQSGRVEPGRDFVVTAFERHTICRRDGKGYPMRSLRTHLYSYIRNYEPQRWPAGDPDFVSSHQGFYGDVDAGAAKTFLIANSTRKDVARYVQLAFGRRPGEELYDLTNDPEELRNVADSPEFQEVKEQLRSRLQAYLKATDDPRQRGDTPWEGFPFFSGNIYKSPNWRESGIEVQLPKARD